MDLLEIIQAELLYHFHPELQADSLLNELGGKTI